MEDSKFFRFVNRANSVLIFLLVCGGLALTLYLFVASGNWHRNKTVNVAENPGDSDSPKIELVLGRVVDMSGSNSQYVELKSKGGGKLSSGRSSGETRNVLFISDDTFDTKWIFPNHNNYIVRVFPLKVEQYKSDSTVISVYFEFIDTDTNGNGRLDQNDSISVALLNPNGGNFTVIGSGMNSIVDNIVSDDGKTFTFIAQKNNDVILTKIDLSDYTIVNSKSILKIDEKL